MPGVRCLSNGHNVQQVGESLKRLLCLSRSYKPVSSILSSNRIFCSRRGIELEYLNLEEPVKRVEIQTTIKRGTRLKSR